MGTRIFKCQECDSTVLKEWEASFNPPYECPYCGSERISYISTRYDSEYERATDEANSKAEKKQFKILSGAFLVFLALIFPGVLLLMLLHQFIVIESAFFNWILTLVFSGVILLAFKGNIKTYLIVDCSIFVIGTILSWCIKDFAPFSFAMSYLFNIWGLLFGLIIGAFALFYLIPQEYNFLKNIDKEE